MAQVGLTGFQTGCQRLHDRDVRHIGVQKHPNHHSVLFAWSPVVGLSPLSEIRPVVKFTNRAASSMAGVAYDQA